MKKVRNTRPAPDSSAHVIEPSAGLPIASGANP